MGTLSHNHYPVFNNYWVASQGFTYPSIKSWYNPENISFPWDYANVLKSHTHHSEQYQPPMEEKPTTICLIIYNHFTHIKLRHRTCDRCKWYLSRRSHRRCSVREVVLRNFTKFTRKHLCHSLFFNKVAGLRPATLLKKRLQYRCFPVNFVKFLRTPFLQKTSRRLLLSLKPLG